MIPLTEYEQQEIDKINQLSHEEMCRMFRFHPRGHPYFASNLPFFEPFKKRLWNHFGGFTPEISKKIGWEK